MTDLITKISEGIQHIQLNRADKKNALTKDMYLSLANTFKEGEQNNAVKVNFLYGVPGCFTAGNDLNDFMTYAELGTIDSSVEDFLIAISHLQKPLILAIEGPAVGIGTTMVLHADLVYATDSAFFATPFAGLGLTPEAASSYLMPKTIGYVRAFEMLALGAGFTAKKAKEVGLINDILPDEDFISQCETIAKKLASQPQEAIKMTKQLLRDRERQLVTDIMTEEIEIFKRQLKSKEALDAFTAFLSKKA